MASRINESRKESKQVILSPISPSSPNLTSYYQALWEEHCQGKSKNRLLARELISYFVLPVFSTTDHQTCECLFSSSGRCNYIIADSGYGKSTLLDMVILTNIVSYLNSNAPESLSADSKSRLAEYNKIKTALLGNISNDYIPVYIDSFDIETVTSLSAMADKSKPDLITIVAEAHDTQNFSSIVDYAANNNRLLFLIEALDEVKKDKLPDYLSAIDKLYRKYPTAHIIITTRALGNTHLPFDNETLFINALSDNAVLQISDAITGQGSEVLNMINTYSWLQQLTRIPFMLQSLLKMWPQRPSAVEFLNQVVDDIIKRRWDMNGYNIFSSPDDIKVLLGYLACHYIWGNQNEDKTISYVRQVFHKGISVLPSYTGLLNTFKCEDVEDFIKILPIKSGILSMAIDEKKEAYVFQENLIMCQLAAYCICQFLRNRTDSSPNDVVLGTYSFDSFFRQEVQVKDVFISDNALITILFVINLVDNRRKKILITYIFDKLINSTDQDEKEKVAKVYRWIVDGAFGACEAETNLLKDTFDAILSIQK